MSNIQKTKEIPEKIYMLASMGQEIIKSPCPACKNSLSMTIAVPLAGHFCKAFTIDEAGDKMAKLFPKVQFRLLSQCTVMDFLNGCKIEIPETKSVELVVATEQPEKESRKTKRQYYAEIKKELAQAGKMMLSEDEQKVLAKMLNLVK